MTADEPSTDDSAATDASTDGSPTDPTGTDEPLTDPEPILGDHPGGPHREEPPFPAIADAVREYYAADASGHDMAHVWRVFRLGVQFADDLGADRVVVGAAALTHDLHRVVDEGFGVDPVETFDEIRAILSDADFPDAKVEDVLHCVAVHDTYEFRGDDPAPESLEAEIVRDADNLDAMGAVGIARTFAFGSAHGTPLWDPDGREYSQLYHFEDKLLRLREELHTAPARELAEQRHAFLEEFHERFRREWHGDA